MRRQHIIGTSKAVLDSSFRTDSTLIHGLQRWMPQTCPWIPKTDPGICSKRSGSITYILHITDKKHTQTHTYESTIEVPVLSEQFGPFGVLDGAALGKGWRGRLSVSFVKVINVSVLLGMRQEQRHQREQESRWRPSRVMTATRGDSHGRQSHGW